VADAGQQINGENIVAQRHFCAKLNELAGKHVCGRLDLVEGRFVAYEVPWDLGDPRRTLLLEAHRGQRIRLPSTAAAMHLKTKAWMPRYAELIL